MFIGDYAILAVLNEDDGVELYNLLVKNEKIKWLKNKLLLDPHLVSLLDEDRNCVLKVFNKNIHLLDKEIKECENRGIVSKIEMREYYQLFDYCQDTGLFVDGLYPIIIFDNELLFMVVEYLEEYGRIEEKSNKVIDFINDFKLNYNINKYKILYYCLY